MIAKIVKDAPDEYHAVKAVSNSGISHLLNSAAKFRAWQDGNYKIKQTDTLLLGSVVHCLVFEPDQFIQRYAIKKENGTTKAGKDEQAQADQKGIVLVKKEIMDQAQYMSKSVRNQPKIKNFLALPDLQCETSIYWHEEIDEVIIPCKMRLDAGATLPDYGYVPSDLKSTADASPAGFARSMAIYNYYRQAAWYLRGLQAAGKNASTFMFIAAEKEAPYLVAPYLIHEKALQKGRYECDNALSIYAESVKSDNWRGFTDEIMELDLPEWAYQ